MVDRVRPACGLALAALLLLAAPISAQSHRFALGLTGGWAQYEDLTPGLGVPTVFEPGWTAGGQLEAWPGGGRVGLRLNGTYAQGKVEDATESPYDIMTADLGMLVRFLGARDGRWVSPYLTLGAGAAFFRDAGAGWPAGYGVYGDDPVSRAMLVGGLGFDLFGSRHAGLRVEAVDRVVLAAFGESPPSDGMPLVHYPQVSTALQLRFGSLAETVVPLAAVPAPRSQPVAAAPAPASDAEMERMRLMLAERSGENARLRERLMALEQRVEALATEPEPASPVTTVAAPAPAPAPARRPESMPAAATEGLYTVQVGAFVEVETARRWAERLKGRNLPVWLTEVEVKGQRVTRVRVGALPSQAEADNLANALRRAYDWPTWVDRVHAGELVPRDAVAATRAFLYGE